MNRRQFLKEVSLWCGGLTLSIPCFKIASAGPLPQKPPPVLSVGRSKDYLALTAKCRRMEEPGSCITGR